MRPGYTTIGEHDFYTVEWEGDEKRTVLAIHGLSGNFAHMTAVAESLAPRFRAVAYDVRGRGNSDPADAPSRIRHHARDAAALVEALGVERVLLVGHSMGAFIAAMVAGLPGMRDKVAGVVLLDGAGQATEEGCAVLEPALARLDQVYPGPDAYVEAMKPVYAGLGLAWNCFIESAVRHEIGARGYHRYTFKGEPARIREDLWDLPAYDHELVFGAARCPFLLAHAAGSLGDCGPLFSDASFAVVKRLVPDLEWYESPANHYTLALQTQPGLTRRIEDFAARCGF